ncbi:hypothetical protein CDAR_546011 [Caerostris darwini]|uniref:Uncharacterized protein n=1 Tax=Caerostris darwini TaxID=1538125 RepID=A0AAV4X3A1_9ARAC|nr:hypothetical protein CDAR_546011 [Caerostris darwini]
MTYAHATDPHVNFEQAQNPQSSMDIYCPSNILSAQFTQLWAVGSCDYYGAHGNIFHDIPNRRMTYTHATNPHINFEQVQNPQSSRDVRQRYCLRSLPGGVRTDLLFAVGECDHYGA